MRMSTIKQSVVPRSGQAKNSSAEANTLAVNPTERMKPRKDSRTDSSSSTIEMIGWCATLILILRGAPQRLLCVGTVLPYVGIIGRREREGWLLRMVNTPLLGHYELPKLPFALVQRGFGTAGGCVARPALLLASRSHGSPHRSSLSRIAGVHAIRRLPIAPFLLRYSMALPEMPPSSFRKTR